MLEPHSFKPGSVNILIGPNGSGKSTLLRQWSEELKVSAQSVLAMSPSIYDRFVGMRGANFKYYGARQGRGAVSRVIRDALIKAHRDGPHILKAVTQTLKYVDFDGKIGVRIQIRSLKPDLRGYFPEKKLEFSEEYTEELYNALSRWYERSNEGRDILEFSLDHYSFSELSSLSLIELLENEAYLKRFFLISKIEYFFFRNEQPIPLMEACSGELSFVAGLTYITTNITERTVVAIDEPENSLHPNWQKDYVEILLDLFQYYQPVIIIATHSPIIISGAQLEEAKGNFFSPINVYRVDAGFAEPFEHDKLSLEEMYDRLFGIITPKNHHLSNVAVELMNELSEGKRDYASVTFELKALREKSYDDKQQEVIDRFIEVAGKLNGAINER